MFRYDPFRSYGGRDPSGPDPAGGVKHRPCVRCHQHSHERTVSSDRLRKDPECISEDGLPIGAGLEDLGKGLRSQIGTMYGTLKKGPRYLEMAEGYVTGIALDAEDQIIGYQFVNLGKMTDFIKKGDDPTTAYEKAKGQYGRVADAVKIIDPRME